MGNKNYPITTQNTIAAQFVQNICLCEDCLLTEAAKSVTFMDTVISNVISGNTCAETSLQFHVFTDVVSTVIVY